MEELLLILQHPQLVLEHEIRHVFGNLLLDEVLLALAFGDNTGSQDHHPVDLSFILGY